jgi:hypothetical protein
MKNGKIQRKTAQGEHNNRERQISDRRQSPRKSGFGANQSGKATINLVAKSQSAIKSRKGPSLGRQKVADDANPRKSRQVDLTEIPTIL